MTKPIYNFFCKTEHRQTGSPVEVPPVLKKTTDVWLTCCRCLAEMCLTLGWHVADIWLTCSWLGADNWLTCSRHIADMWLKSDWQVVDMRPSYGYQVAVMWLICCCLGHHLAIVRQICGWYVVMQKDIVLSYIILYYIVYVPSYTISYIYFAYTIDSLTNPISKLWI